MLNTGYIPKRPELSLGLPSLSLSLGSMCTLLGAGSSGKSSFVQQQAARALYYGWNVWYISAYSTEASVKDRIAAIYEVQTKNIAAPKALDFSRLRVLTVLMTASQFQQLWFRYYGFSKDRVLVLVDDVYAIDATAEAYRCALDLFVRQLYYNIVQSQNIAIVVACITKSAEWSLRHKNKALCCTDVAESAKICELSDMVLSLQKKSVEQLEKIEVGLLKDRKEPQRVGKVYRMFPLWEKRGGVKNPSSVTEKAIVQSQSKVDRAGRIRDTEKRVKKAFYELEKPLSSFFI